MWLKTVDKAIKAKYPNMEIWKADLNGYFVIEYYVPSMGGIVGQIRHRDRSVYVFRLNQLTLDQWIEEADALAEEVINVYGSI